MEDQTESVESPISPEVSGTRKSTRPTKPSLISNDPGINAGILNDLRNQVVADPSVLEENDFANLEFAKSAGSTALEAARDLEPNELDEAFKALAPRDRKIFRDLHPEVEGMLNDEGRPISPLSKRTIANNEGLSESRVAAIEKRALAQLRSYIRSK